MAAAKVNGQQKKNLRNLRIEASGSEEAPMKSEVGHAGSKEKTPGSDLVKTIDTILRCWHVAVMSILVGGIFWKVPFPQLHLWHALTIASGACLVALGIYKSRHWLYQGDGVMAELHVALLAVIHINYAVAVPVVSAVLVIGVVGSHMPRKLRHYSFRHKKRID